MNGVSARVTDGLDIQSFKLSPDGTLIYYLSQPEAWFG